MHEARSDPGFFFAARRNKAREIGRVPSCKMLGLNFNLVEKTQ